MALITRPCYCTREQVRRALDVTRAVYNNDQIDGAILSAADKVDKRCARRFYPVDATYKFDWPNYQYAYPWRLWLDHYEMAAQPTQVVTGTFLPTPVVIPINAVIMQPVNQGPPFTSLELRRDLSNAFGANTTPQLDIGITGTFGYWMQTRAAGQTAATVNTGDLTVQVTNSALVGPGDVLIAGSERMIVTDSQFVTTGAVFLTGITTASASDNLGTVANGALFAPGEVLLLDSEIMLIENVLGNNIMVKRAWDGTVLSAHSGGTLYATRLLSVLRGQLGTTAATYASGTALSVNDVPGLIRQLAIAEAEVQVASEPGAYLQAVGGLGAGSGLGITTGSSGRNQAREAAPGTGLPFIQNEVDNSQYCRKARSRVI